MKIPFCGSQFLDNANVVVFLSAPDATAQIHVTKITASILTHANAKFFAIQDSDNSPLVIAKHTDSTAGPGVLPTITWDFGSNSPPENSIGIGIGVGKDLCVVSEASGPNAIIYMEGYTIKHTTIPAA